jgi:hypothetical protein
MRLRCLLGIGRSDHHQARNPDQNYESRFHDGVHSWVEKWLMLHCSPIRETGIKRLHDAEPAIRLIYYYPTVHSREDAGTFADDKLRDDNALF